MGNGTIKAKEEALGVLWQLVAMMAESNVDVNISPGPAADIAALLTSGIETTALVRLASRTYSPDGLGFGVTGFGVQTV